MKTTELIQLLAELALKNCRENVHPDPYAATAAHTIAAAAAAKFSPESADAAAFVSVSSMLDLSVYSAQQAVSVTQMNGAMRNYHAKDEESVDPKIIVSAFTALIKQLEQISFSRHANAAYESTFEPATSDHYSSALHAAYAIYTHAYACSRAAYTHAAALAARYPVEQRDTAFKDAITARLSSDLLSEPIEPSFFMHIMCSETAKVVGALLLVAGLAALSLGICGLAMVPVGAMLLSATSLSSASLTVAGIVSAATGGGLFAGRFFAAKKWQNDNEASAHAVNAINDFEPARMPTPTKTQ